MRQISTEIFNPKNQAWLEVCVTPESNFFHFVYLFENYFLFLWFIYFQTSPVHYIYSLDLWQWCTIFFGHYNLKKKELLFSKKQSHNVDHVLPEGYLLNLYLVYFECCSKMPPSPEKSDFFTLEHPKFFSFDF